MSGIYGIYRYDGAPVDPQWLQRMRKAMAYYGPHGGACIIDRSIGMGHLLLEINPEDAFERQPMRCPRGLVVTSARLDNREALLDAFNIPSSEAPQTSDGHLVSLAFDRWGEDVCTHLEGDWALAAWDANSRRLLLSRDVYGSAALYYYQGKGFIAYASTLKSLLELPGIVKEPDKLALAEILVIWQHDAELTSYKNFRRLPWAHSMVVAPDGGNHTKRYWSSEGRELLRFAKDEEYFEAFLDHYGRAIKSCLRSRKPIASELSGGRDSGSVVTLAAHVLASQGRELTAYTSVPYLPPDGAKPTQIGNEWEQAHTTATMAGPNVRHIPIDARDYRVMDGIEHLLDAHDEPSQAPANAYWMEAVMQAASRDGNAILLNAAMGNCTVSWDGNGSAALALLQGKPSDALQLLLHAEPTFWLTLKRQILKPVLKPPLLALHRRRSSPTQDWRGYSALNVHLADELSLNERMQSAGYHPSLVFSPLQNLRRFLLAPDFGFGFSIATALAARQSLAVIDPTANFSLFKFLLSVPDHLYYRRGEHSFLMNRAFLNRMPDRVLHNRQRGMQAADVGHRIIRELPAFRECLSSLESIPEAQEILGFELLRHCLEELVADVNPTTTANAIGILGRGISVGLFLRRLTTCQVQPC